MLSRTAENLYWLARYVERAEYLARTIEATLRVTALPNPSSIRNCIESARLNSRSVRTALTSEMWDTINSAWIDLGELWGKGTKTREDLTKFLRFVQETSLRFDGSAYRTMLCNDAYWFSRLGLHLE